MILVHFRISINSTKSSEYYNSFKLNASSQHLFNVGLVCRHVLQNRDKKPGHRES